MPALHFEPLRRCRTPNKILFTPFDVEEGELCSREGDLSGGLGGAGGECVHKIIGLDVGQR